MECKSLRDSGSEIRRFNVAYFAASVDSAETNRKFAESLQLDYPILSDPDKSIASAYGVLNDSGQYARRWTFYIDKEGKIEKIDKEVKPASSGADLVSNLESLGYSRKAE
jgi:peroxiredoxin Q/BCP